MPEDVARELLLLSAALDVAVPSKQLDRNLLVASWNIRELGGLTEKWTTGTGDSPKRNAADIHYIAEILSRFDVIAVQEVQADLRALRLILQCLGSEWAFHVTDVTEGQAGDHERLAYVYDLRRVRPSGLAGELVLSPEDLGHPPPPRPRAGHPPPDPPSPDPLVPGLDHQLVKTPYIMSFTTAGRPFALATVHVLWGEDDELIPRAREAEALAKMLTRAVKPGRRVAPDDFMASLIALGDFNITSADDPIYKALVDNDLQPDAETLDSRRGPGDRPGRQVAFDQIAWFRHPHDGFLKFKRLSGDTFPWSDHILQDAPGDTTFRISDHYPLWLEFSVRETV
jgi:endonuclease/exonuclease/phosphatase family metal-dependent hydrolase